MEFKFSVNDIFKTPIVEIDHSLIPPGFTGDKRTFWDVVGKVSEVVNAMGEASAAAQGLTKPITTAERLRNSEQKVYLLIDKTAGNGRGAVTGMLKIGKKGLYVFDRNGQHYQVSPPCVLDFYVHESRQRTGLGKRLFEHMLQAENIEPVKMAIDRPSEKFLGFLNKHYTLKEPVKQMNNYVVFDGFFPSTPEKNGTVEQDHSGGTPGKKQSANGLQTTSYTSPWGRYGAPKPPCSMGQIIHNQTSTIPKNTEPTGVRSAPETNYQHATGNSPGNPAYVTQSTPNMCYRPPEQQQNPEIHQNQQYHYQTPNNPNDLKYYQQQQSNNVWQSLGSVPPNSINDQNKINFNGQVINNYEPSYQGDQQNPHGFNQQMQGPGIQQNYVNQLAKGITQQPPVFEGQRQATYQSTQQYNNQNAQDYMQQIQNPLQYRPSQYNTTPNTSPVVQNIQPQMSQNTFIPNQPQQVLPQNNIPQMQGHTLNANQPQQMVSQSAPLMQENITYHPMNLPQQMGLQGDGQYIQRIERQSQLTNPHNTNVQNNLQNEPLLSQQNAEYLQNSDTNHTAPIMSVRPSYQALPQQNVVGYGQLPPQFSPTQSSQSVTKAAVQQYNNQMVLNQPQDAYNGANKAEFQNTLTNQVLQSNVIPNANIQNQHQNTASYTIANQVPRPNVLPETNILGQPINLPQQNVSATNLANEGYNSQNNNQGQNITSLAPNTSPQTYTNNNMVNANSMVQTQNMTPRTSLSQQPVNSAQVTQSQSNVFDENRLSPQIPHRMEGSHLNNSNRNQEMLPIHVAKGDMKPIENDEVIFKYGYPPQVSDPDTQVMEEKVSSSPKLERPRSLSIQLSEEQTEDKKKDDVESEVPSKETDIEEEILEKLTVSENGADVIESKDEMPPTDKQQTPGKRTPSHLTEQGFFDLKFYHNKLW